LGQGLAYTGASSMRLARLAFLLGSLVLAPLAGPAACSDEPLKNHEPGSPDGGGGGTCGEEAPCAVTFRYPLHGETSVVLRGDFAPDGWTNGVPMTIDGGSWTATLQVENGRAIQYKFFVDGANWVTDPGNPSQTPDGQGGQNSVVVASCAAMTMPACEGDGGPPPIPPGSFDWRSAVMYFVFVDRFLNGDPSNDAPVGGIEVPANYQGGDYAGLLAKIEAGYFDDLGVNALWLTVPMDNPSVAGSGADGHAYSAYHGYWPSDLDKVEEHFGDLALLKKVVDAAHEHDIKVLFDYAMNHVHQDAAIYKQQPSWFWPLDYNGKYCVCGDGCNWDDSYEQRRCWFRDYLPDWNFTVPEARAYSVDNAIKWIKDTGIDGFRLDAVKHIETVWISDLRTRVTNEIEPASKQHFYMVGETFDSGNRDFIKSYVEPKGLLDGQFDFPLRGVLVETLLRRSGTMYDLDGFLATNDTYYDPGVMSTFLGNHDLARVIQTALDQPWGTWDNGGTSNWTNTPGAPGNRAPYERMAVGFTFLLTTKGIPLIYYGDEIGMPGSGDPDNRRIMQWSGYSPDQTFLRDTIGKLGKARKDHPALWKGTRQTRSVSDDTYGYMMSDGTDTVYVALNRGDTDAAVGGMPDKGKDLLSGQDVTGPSVNLPPRTSMVIIPSP
jgi:glycosidase